MGIKWKKVTMVVVKHLKTGAQRGCENSITGDFKNWIGLSPEQPEITEGNFLAGDETRWPPEVPSHPSYFMILLLCPSL